LIGFVFWVGHGPQVQRATDHGHKETAPFQCHHLSILN
jgi:hypothetical protein